MTNKVDYKEVANKIALDLVQLSVEFRSLVKHISVKAEGIEQFIVVSTMCNIAIDKYTSKKENKDDIKNKKKD